MHVEAQESLEQLRELTRQQKRAREYRRFRAVELAREGRTAGEVAATLACGVRPVQEWVRRYNEGGASGLAEGEHPGRPAGLRPGQEAALRARLEAGPRKGEEVFGVLPKLSSVDALLHRLGYSHQCPRPRHPQADPAAREAFQ